MIELERQFLGSWGKGRKIYFPAFVIYRLSVYLSMKQKERKLDRAEYIKNYLEINYSVKSKEDIASELGLKHSRGVKRKKDIFMSIEGVIA